jgi:hypothetical protein
MPGVVLTDATDDPTAGRLFLGVNENGGITIKYDQVQALMGRDARLHSNCTIQSCLAALNGSA